MTHLSFSPFNIEGRAAPSTQESSRCLLTAYINYAHDLQTAVQTHRPQDQTVSTTILGFLQEAAFVLFSSTVQVAF